MARKLHMQANCDGDDLNSRRLAPLNNDDNNDDDNDDDNDNDNDTPQKQTPSVTVWHDRLLSLEQPWSASKPCCPLSLISDTKGSCDTKVFQFIEA